MAVYKRGATYYYEFELRGRRLRGSTGCTSEREARAVERAKREEARKESERREALGQAPLTWGATASRYWTEHAQYHRSPEQTLWALEWLTRHIGESTPLADITGNTVARLVAKRRADGVGPATVNRSVTEPLRRVLMKAKAWGERAPDIKWGDHLLKEPKERVRELTGEEEQRLFAALRPDYRGIVQFALWSGCRLAECVGLTWPDVHWGRLIWINGKGGTRASIGLSSALRELLWALQGHHPESVFTYEVAKASDEARKGERRPVTYEGLKTEWARAVARAGIADLHFHDLRHSFAMRGLRATGNLALVSRMMRHSDVSMTMRYAHTNRADLLAGMEAAAQHRVPPNGPPTSENDRAKAKA
jgi:integrase